MQKKRELVATTSYLPLSLLGGLEFRMQLNHGYVTYPRIMKLEKKSFGRLLRNIYLLKREREEKKKVRENSLSCILSTWELWNFGCHPATWTDKTKDEGNDPGVLEHENKNPGSGGHWTIPWIICLWICVEIILLIV